MKTRIKNRIAELENELAVTDYSYGLSVKAGVEEELVELRADLEMLVSYGREEYRKGLLNALALGSMNINVAAAYNRLIEAYDASNK